MSHTSKRGASWVWRVILVSAVYACAAAGEPALPPPPASAKQWSIAMIPDPQGYNQSYDIRPGEKWAGKGYQYKERFVQQIRWIVANRERYNIRFASNVGDNVQHFGYDPVKAKDPASDDAKIRGEWLNAVSAMNGLHQGGDPARPAHLPYAVAIGNHDYHSSNRADLTSTEYEEFFGPGRWRDAGGAIRPAVADWYKGDDKGWRYVADGAVATTGTGRNSYQTFSAGGRAFLHLTLECAATNQALAWAQEVLDRHRGTPTVITIHGFLRGGLADADRMGRRVDGGANRTNDAQQIWDKLIFPNDQIFLLLCGHIYMQEHVVKKNSRGHDVHLLEACYHLNYAGGRIKISEKPPGGWAYEGKTDDLDRNGSGWLRLLLFDPGRNRITAYTYSPVLDLWAPNRPPNDVSRPDGQDGVWWNRTFPTGDKVVEEFFFDFNARFGDLN